jgi:hypothetical protein
MIAESTRWQELDSLLDRILDGIHQESDCQRLNDILRHDEDACRRYVLYMDLHGRLAWGDAMRSQRAFDAADQELDGLEPHDCAAFSPCLPIICETLPSISSSSTSFNNILFSYTVAAVAVGIGLLIGWTCRVSISEPQFAAEPSERPVAMRKMQPLGVDKQFIGQVTGMFECDWADSATATVNYAYVPLGRRYALKSGLMEITYDSGARVILQGPCVFEVASKAGGYLAIGKVTARSEKRRSNDSELPIPNSELFAIRTPTAVVTDLGTEFGVEVEESGESFTHVFQGKVEVRPSGAAKAVPLAVDESARVELRKGQTPRVVRQTNLKTVFVREMAKAAPIAVFNTGIGLKAGNPDPHWQIVACSSDPAFQPRPAIVRGWRDAVYLEDDPDRSRWLSTAADDVQLPQDVFWTFQTTFDLTGMLPSTAGLRVRFIADDRVAAIRLNGHEIRVPAQRDGLPFDGWACLQITSGFVKGKNVLEFDVLNLDPFQTKEQRREILSRMIFRAEIEGGATRDPRLTDSASAIVSPPVPAVEKSLATSAKKPLAVQGAKDTP